MSKCLPMLVATLSALATLPAQATPVTFIATLSGANENPVNASPGTGFAEVIFDFELHTMQIEVTFSDLLGTTTAAHIHCCVAAPNNTGVATTTPTFPGFPLGVTAGLYSNLFNTADASTYRAAFITANGGTAAGAEAALYAGLQAGQAYFNIHTSEFGGGEIRGFLQQVPEPSGYALAGLALAALGLSSRRRPG